MKMERKWKRTSHKGPAREEDRDGEKGRKPERPECEGTREKKKNQVVLVPRGAQDLESGRALPPASRGVDGVLPRLAHTRVCTFVFGQHQPPGSRSQGQVPPSLAAPAWLPGDRGIVGVGAGREVLVQLGLGIHDVHLILILTESGGARAGQQDELSEAVEVRHVAESL